MPDKLTDNEIVKALECCKYEYDTKCELCCYNFYSRTGCRGELRRNALDLINRLQAENEQLTKDKENLAYSLANAVGQKMTAKAEAYEECIEKLNDKSIRSKAKVKGCGFLYVSVVTLHDINKLKKELVGEDK